MADKKQIKVRVFPDGRIEAETVGVKGQACTDYIEILERLLDAETVDSSYTAEYYETEQVEARQRNVNSTRLV